MLKTSIFLLVAIFAGCQGAPADSEWDWRIVGGSDAAVGVVPWQASLRSILNLHFCGGTIIAKRTILTAAHCVAGRKASLTRVYVGTNTITGGTKMSVESISAHPDFDTTLLYNDIAVVITEQDIVMSDVVAMIPISRTELGGDVSVTLSGWGTTSYPGLPPKNLQIITLKTVTFDDCKTALASVNPVYETQLCTFTKAGEGACHGDSGGPLTDDKSVVGIVSWGQPCAKGVPDVFTRVSSFADWVDERTVGDKPESI